MPNPLLTQNGNAQSFTNFVESIKDPKAYATQLINQNPAARNFISQLPNSTSNPREMAYMLAKQKGIDPKQIDQIASRFGLNTHGGLL